MRQSGEPSVEEILQSIKQVIARDNRAGARMEHQRRATQGLVDTFAGDYPLPRQPAPSANGQFGSGSFETGAFEEEDILDLDEAEQLSTSTGAGGDEDEPSLIQPEVRNSMRESLAALAMLSEPGAPPQIVRSGETSLEGLVRDMLRPALAEWLDKNLPPLVERLVAAEIARIVGKKG